RCITSPTPTLRVVGYCCRCSQNPHSPINGLRRAFRKVRMLLFVMSKSAAVALIALGWGVSSGLASADPPAPAPPPPPAPASPPPAAPAGGPKTTIDHDGIYNVGTDIVPGVYTSAGPVG